jgi:hypothetical protein
LPTYTNYRFPVPEARALASMESIKQDLTGVVSYCDRLEALMDSRPDFLIWDALCSAMVVRYARCFSSGARDPLPHTLLDGASEEQRKLHEYVMDVRNKHVAHSVNSFEETDVTVTVCEDDDFIHSIAMSHGRFVGLSYEFPGKIRELAQWLLAHADQVIERERSAMLEIARELGPEKVKAFGVVRIELGDADRYPKRGRSKP